MTNSIRKVGIYMPIKNNENLLYKAIYEAPLLREVCKHRNRNNQDFISKFKVVLNVDPEQAGVLDNVRIDQEMARLRRQYRELFTRAYPTDTDFEEAFYEAVKQYGTSVGADGAPDYGSLGDDREELEIEVIKGIGPSRADDIAQILGDGTLATLAQAVPMEIQGLDNLSLRQAKAYIAEARERCGVKDETEIVDDEPATLE